MGTPPDRKPRLYAKLNSFAWRERWQSLIFPAFICFAILVVLLVPVFSRIDHWREGDRLTGTIIDIKQMERNEQIFVAPLVDLDSGPIVGLPYVRVSNFERGQRVVVQEYVSNIVRGRRYEFIALISSD